jgi:hypothetical protein
VLLLLLLLFCSLLFVSRALLLRFVEVCCCCLQRLLSAADMHLLCVFAAGSVCSAAAGAAGVRCLSGSIVCQYNTDVIQRDPRQCRPDWYGDITSFMGRGADLHIPNAIKYKVTNG